MWHVFYHLEWRKRRLRGAKLYLLKTTQTSDGWMASLIHWTWTWANSGRWWGTEKPGMLQFTGSQRVGHDLATELNWTECEQTTHWKSPWCWERLRTEGEEGVRGWDGWIASLMQWTWTWANSGRWWGTERPGMLQSMGSQRVGHNWVVEQQQEQNVWMLGGKVTKIQKSSLSKCQLMNVPHRLVPQGLDPWPLQSLTLNTLLKEFRKRHEWVLWEKLAEEAFR